MATYKNVVVVSVNVHGIIYNKHTWITKPLVVQVSMRSSGGQTAGGRHSSLGKNIVFS